MEFLSDGHLRPFGKDAPERRGVDRLAPVGLSFQPVIQALCEPSCIKVISRLGGPDDETLEGGNFEPDGPFRILMVGPLVEHDPAVTSEVEEILVVGMGLGQTAQPDQGSSKSGVNWPRKNGQG